MTRKSLYQLLRNKTNKQHVARAQTKGASNKGLKFSRNKLRADLKSRNVCYHSAQNFLSSSLLFKNKKIKYTEL